jgi:GTP-binding protein HflX
VVDISSPAAWQQMESVDAVLASLGCDKLPQITLLNKVDIADDMSMAEMLACHRPDSLCISAVTGAGLDRLAQDVRRRAQGDTAEITVLIPHTDGKLVGEIGRLADIRDRRYRSDGVELDIRINRAQLSQLRGRYETLCIVKGDSVPPREPA